MCIRDRVVPVRPELAWSGTISVEFLPTLNSDAVLESYGAHLTRSWPRDLGLLEWRMLENYLSWDPVPSDFAGV